PPPSSSEMSASDRPPSDPLPGPLSERDCESVPESFWGPSDPRRRRPRLLPRRPPSPDDSSSAPLESDASVPSPDSSEPSSADRSRPRERRPRPPRRRRDRPRPSPPSDPPSPRSSEPYRSSESRRSSASSWSSESSSNHSGSAGCAYSSCGAWKRSPPPAGAATGAKSSDGAPDEWENGLRGSTGAEAVTGPSPAASAESVRSP